MSHYQSRAIDPTVYPAISHGIGDGTHSHKAPKFALDHRSAFGCCLDTLYREHERGTLDVYLRLSCVSPTCRRVWVRDTHGRWVIEQPAKGRRPFATLRHGRGVTSLRAQWAQKRKEEQA